MKIKIEVRKSRKAKVQKFYSVIIAKNGQPTYSSEMYSRRQAALKTANAMKRYINDGKGKAEVVDLARTYRKGE